MNLKTIVNNSRKKWINPAIWWVRDFAGDHPAAVLGMVLVAGMGLGIGGSIGYSQARTLQLQARVSQQQVELDKARHDAQLEINALAARMGELQAQANRLNALGERLTRAGQLQDGEFDFDKPVGVGGGDDDDESVHDMPLKDLTSGIDELGSQFGASGQQLSVLESLLFDRKLDQNAVPSREPIANSYVTSHFGGRADPFGHGGQFHKGMDFHARVGDPVMAVADGVVSYSGVRGGYGNVIEVDHGNGYVTRYAHNSRLTVKVGDLVRAGQEVAKAGSTGRSTGAHVHFEVWENGAAVNPRKFLAQGDAEPVKRG